MASPAIGIIFHPRFPPETLADFARRAENVGFDELWLWDDCFLPGAFTSAAIALSATQRIKVGIGLIPAAVYHPLFAAMEITTLACAFPDRILPGFGYGVGSWMSQIGATPKPSLTTLAETVNIVRALLAGEMVSARWGQAQLDKVQMQLTPAKTPPLYIGAMREKTFRLSGQIADGTILTGMSSPAYARWARTQITDGMAESGRTANRVVAYLDTKVSRDGQSARQAARESLARRYPWADVQLDALGISAEVAETVAQFGKENLAAHIPDSWLDAMTASGTPEQTTSAIHRMGEAGADCVVLQPLNGDLACLDEYSELLLPAFRS